MANKRILLFNFLVNIDDSYFSQEFDGYLILKWLLSNGTTPKINTNEGKIVSLEVTELNTTFLNSLNFNSLSLAHWPGTFGLAGLSKRQFPHKFTRKENWDKVVSFQVKLEFGYDIMSESKRYSLMHGMQKSEKLKVVCTTS